MPIKWIEPVEISVGEELQKSIGGQPLIAESLVRRGFTDIQSARGFLYPDEYTPSPPGDIPDLVLTVNRLLKAIQNGERICVWGDFDVDGQTSTTILWSALKEFGADVSWHIPVRASESHGINIPTLKKLIQDIDLIITCDTGIGEREAIDYAHSQGVSVLVTDHHDIPAELPLNATSIVNPKMLPLGHPAGTLPGVGVVYKLVEELYSRDDEKSPEKFLDLVALGIVTDLAEQVGDTRYYLQRGLENLRNTGRPGLQMMMKLAGLNPTNLTEEHISFIIGPRMNSLGRLYDANEIVEFLTTQDKEKAEEMAKRLEAANSERKLISDQVFQGALVEIDKKPELLKNGSIILTHDAWPTGVIGIVASRLGEIYNCPVILISSPQGQVARGSARSIEGVNVTKAITANQELLLRFGGHPMAAGFALEPENIEQFRGALTSTISQMIYESKIESTLQIDGYLSLTDLSLDLVAEIERLAPFGPGNPGLTLATRNLTWTGYAVVGRNDEHKVITLEDEYGYTQKTINWRGANSELPHGKFDLAYHVRASNFRGQRELQIEWIDTRQVTEPVALSPVKNQAVQIIDHRQETSPVALLQGLQEIEDLGVWREASTDSAIIGYDRLSIAPREKLVIWTTPPSKIVLEHVLQVVKPEVIYLFANDPGMDRPKDFLKRLLGLVKYSINHDNGSLDIQVLAAATAHQNRTVQIGINWLEGHGYIQILDTKPNVYKVREGERDKDRNSEQITDDLRDTLAEAAAFRGYYRKTDLENLTSIFDT
jgi:single-stranded-DNA-specific exonuclease